jgi:hypothetical protein
VETEEEIIKLRERAAAYEANRINDQEAIKILREGKGGNTTLWLALAALISSAVIGGLGILLAAIGIALQVMKGPK